MNLLSYNVRGGGLLSKRKRISFLTQSNKTDLCFLQEININCFYECVARFFWGNNEVEWTASNSIGASGRMVILWAKNSMSELQLQGGRL